MTKKLKIPKEVSGYGYCGVWNSPKNTIGWMCSPFVAGKIDRRYPSVVSVDRYPEVNGNRLFFCEIVIRPLLNKNGRPITKLMNK